MSRAAALGLALVLGVGVAGCNRGEGQAEAEAGADPGPPVFEPLAERPGSLVSADGRMRVTIPAGPGWECVEERLGEGEAGATALRCRRADPGEFLFLAAKLSRQPVDQRTDVRTLLMSLYRADNEAFFDSVDYLRDGAATLAGHPGWEALLEATHAKAGAIRKQERVAIVDGRIYAVSAEGRPELWDAHADAIAAWFAGLELAR